MKTNILVALKNLMTIKDNNLLGIYEDNKNNRANSMGEALEYFTKDLFCSSLGVKNFKNRDIVYSAYLSYLGNKNNPPDFIIERGAAVEVKKIENLSFAKIALNSSYPKDSLNVTNPLLNQACRACEDNYGGWTKKDMIYAIGNVIKDQLRLFWLIDGGCYCANDDIYNKIKTTIKEGVNNIQGVEFAETAELGKVKRIDPLGITDLRIRGMWSIEHPMKVFDYLVEDYNKNNSLQIYCLLLKEKYDSISDEDKNKLDEYIINGTLVKEYVKIKNPNNPAKFLDAVLFKASLE